MVVVAGERKRRRRKADKVGPTSSVSGPGGRGVRVGVGARGFQFFSKNLSTTVGWLLDESMTCGPVSLGRSHVSGCGPTCQCIGGRGGLS